MTFAEKLKTLRHQRNITQVELAAAINISFAIIGQIESGARNPSKEVAKKLSDFFGVALDAFIIESAPVEKKDTPLSNVNMANILLIADIVQEFLNKKGYQITPEQRAQLVEYFYQQNITDAGKINEMLVFMQSMNQIMFIKRK